MPASLKDLRTRIRSVRNTEQITKAMKLVSTAKFGRAQVSVHHAKPYAKALSRVVKDVVASLGVGASHPLMEVSQSDVTHIVVVSSERGLCGSYNTNVSKLTLKVIEEEQNAGRKVAITCLGKKSFQTLSRALGPKGFVIKQCSLSEMETTPDQFGDQGVIRLIATPFEKRVKPFSEALSHLITASFGGKFGKLVFVCTRFESAGSLPLSSDVVLPFDKGSFSAERAAEPTFEPSAQELLDVALPRYLAMAVYQTLLEAVASEHCARMAAMDSANRNAKEMLKKLQITYQRARQAAITKELIEIVSGAEAL
jgi:F-type H+-transporting ATPase subunit gamma